MMPRLRRGRRLALACATGLAIVLAATSAHAVEFAYVITFNNAAVQGRPGFGVPPGPTHLNSPGEAVPLESDEDTSAPAPAPSTIDLSPTTGLPFMPGQDPVANPSFVERGFRVEAFWAVRTGTPDASFARGHFHPDDLASGFEAQHLGHPNELHGLFIRSLDGRPFGVKSVRYRVTRNREIPSKPLSIQGYNNYSVQLLLARSFDPKRSVRVQFIGVPLGLPLGNDLTLPWATAHVFGFEFVEQIFIASSASVDIDDIVLLRNEAEARPPDRPAGRPADATPGATDDDRPMDDPDRPPSEDGDGSRGPDEGQ